MLNEKIQLAKANIYKQATMAGLAIVVTIVLIFAMSVAWYTNVIHSEGLIFETGTWDFAFEGNVEIKKDTQSIFPGDSGVIELHLENTSDDTIGVLVNVTKNTENFPDLMKRRIYFYVDDSQVINGETLEKVYVNETEEYKYIILPQNTLELEEEYHSDPYLKWEWVYDVLGYYVTGTLKEDGTLEVVDYMRPVTYDYDKATFDAETGELLTVSDGITKEEFLKTLYETDGFYGSEVLEYQNGYYPVVVDENTNHGVWLYLCNKEEIETNIEFDTTYAQEIKEEFFAKLLITGQKEEEVTATASTISELKTQLNEPTVKRVVLTGDMEVSDKIEIINTNGVVLDLSGHTLSLNSDGFVVKENASFTVLNGEIKGTGSQIGIKSTGGEVTLNEVVISDVARGVNVIDDNVDANLQDSRVKITNCEIKAEVAGVFARGNNGKSARKTSILIKDTKIESNGYGVAGNGSEIAAGTDIEIIRSTISGAWSGVYHPQSESFLYIEDSTISGETAIAIKAGNINIFNSQITGTGEKQEPAYATSGYTSTGAAVYVETGYNKPIELKIGGPDTMLTSKYTSALIVYKEDSEFTDVEVTGGRYSSEVGSRFLAENYECKKISDSLYEVGQLTQIPEESE